MLVHVDAVLSESLQPVLRDLRVAGMPVPMLRDDDWAEDPETATAMLWSPEDGSGTGVRVGVTAPLGDRVAVVADQLQEWAIEQSWSTWPACPGHPGGQPLTASTRDGVAVWVGPGDGISFRSIGALCPQLARAMMRNPGTALSTRARRPSDVAQIMTGIRPAAAGGRPAAMSSGWVLRLSC